MRTVFVLALLCAIGCLSLRVEAGGQMFVDKIEPVKDTRVNFLSNLASPDAILEDATTNELFVLKQFELQIPVEDVVLTGNDGVSFTGNLGAAFTTNTGDVNFDAQDGDVVMSGTTFDFDSTNDVDLTTTQGDIALTSALNTEFIAGGLDFDIGSGGIDMTAAGDIQMRSRNAVNLKAGNTLALQNEEEVDIVVGGESSITSGDQFIMSAGGSLTGDATFDAHFRSIEDLSIVSGGDGVSFSGQQANIIAVGEFLVEGSTFSATAQEELRVIGGAVCADVRQVTVDAIGIGSNVEAHGDSINLCAADEVSLTAVGISSDVLIDTTTGLNSASDAVVVDSGRDIVIGDVTTNDLSISAFDGFTLDSGNLNFHADEDQSIHANNVVTMTSGDDTLHLAVDLTAVADTQLTITTDLVNINSNAGNSEKDIDFDSDSNMTWATSTISLEAFEHNLEADSISIDVDDFDATSTNRQGVTFDGGDALTFNVGDSVDVETAQFHVAATTLLSVNVDESIIVEMDSIDMFAEDDLIISSTSDVSISSAGDVLLASNIMSLNSDDSIEFENTGTVRMDVDDLQFTSNADLTVSSDGSQFWTLTDNLDVTSNLISMDVSEELYIKTSDLNINGASIGVDVAEFNGQFDSIDVVGGNVTFDSTDFITFNSANDLLVGINGAVLLDVDADVTSTAADISAMTADGAFIASAENNIRLHGVGDFFFNSAAGFSATAEDMSFTGDTVAWLGSDNLSMTSASGVITLGQGDFNIAAGDDVNFSAGASLSFTKGGQATTLDTIALFGMNLDFDASDVTLTSTGTTVFNVGSVDFNGGGDFAVTGEEDILINGESVGATSGSGPIAIAGAAVVIQSGAEQPCTTTAARNIEFTDNAAGGVTIESETNTFYTAGDEVTFTATNNIAMRGDFDLDVSAATGINVTATGVNGLINSFEDLFFISGADEDITVVSSLGSDNISFGRDALLVAHGAEGLTNCGITVTARDTHAYTTYGNSYGGSAGDLEVLARDRFQVHSIDSALASGTATGSGVGNIDVDSDGHTFFHSEESGVMFLTAGTNGLSITTTDAQGSVEFIAHDAYMKLLAEASFSTSASETMDILSDQGHNELAENDITFSSTGDLIATAARGIDIAAETVLTSGDTATLKAQDSFVVQQYGSANGGIDVNVGTGDFTTAVFDGRLAGFNASNALTIDTSRDLRFTAEDGRVVFDADFGDLTFLSGGGLNVISDEGPVSFRTRGEGGSMAIEGPDWAFESTESFVRLFSQDETLITAGDDFNVNADTSFSPGPGHCLTIQSERPNDDVTITGTAGIALVAVETDGNEVGRDRFIVAGNNIDLENQDTATFTLTDLFEVGTSQTPGGEPSYQPVVRVVSNTATFGAQGDIDIISDNTFNSESATSTTVTADNAAWDSNGSLAITAQAPAAGTADVTVTALTDINAVAPILTQTAPDAYIADALASLYIESSGDDIGDRLEIIAGQDLDVTSNIFTTLASVHSLRGNQVDFIAGNNIAISNLVDPTEPSELGSIRFDSATDIDYDAAADVSFDTTSDVARIQVASATAIDFTGGVPLNVLATGLFESGVEFSGVEVELTATTSFDMSTASSYQYFGPAGTNELDEELSGDILFEATADFQLTSITALTMVSGANTTFSSATGDVTLPATASLTFDFTQTVPDYESEFFVDSAEGDISIDGSTVSLAGQGAVPDQLWTLIGDGAITFETDAFTYTATDGLITSTAGTSTTVDATTLTLTSATNVEFLTTNVKGNIELTDINPASMTPGNNMLVTALGGEVAWDNGGGITLTVVDTFTTETTVGDINVLASTTLDLTGQQGIFVTALGASENGHGIDFEAGTTFSSTSQDTMFFNGRQFHNFVADTVDFTVANTMDLITYNAESNIEFHALDDVILTSATSTTVSSPDIDVHATLVNLQGATVNVETFFDHTDFVVTTNERGFNLGGSITDAAGSTRTINTLTDIFVRCGAGGANGIIDAEVLGAGLTVTSNQATTQTEPAEGAGILVIAEEGVVHLDATTTFTATSSAGSTQFNSGASAAIDGSTSVTASGSYVEFSSEHGRIRMIDTSAATMTLTAQNLLFRTIGYGHERDISFGAQQTNTVTVTGNLNVQALGGEGSVNFNADDTVDTTSNTVSFTSASTATTVADAGIRFLSTNNILGVPTGFTADSADDVLIMTLNFLDDIFFQSDFRVEFSALSGNGQISHTRYNYRLGFFSTNPAHVHHVNLQDEDQCLSAGWCGFTNPENAGNANAAINNVSFASLSLQLILQNYGLVAWKHAPS